MTNWGHPQRIGLTEIQLFDTMRHRVAVNLNKMRVKGVDKCRGQLEYLFNNKFKVSSDVFLIIVEISWMDWKFGTSNL